MTKFKPVNIQGAVTDVEFNSWFFQAEMYKEYIPKLPNNQIAKVVQYDQKKDKSCVVFSACGMITYNCGLEFEFDEIREMWQEYQGDQGGSGFKTTTQIGQRFRLEHFPVDTHSKEFEMLLDKGWGVQIAVWSDLNFYVDAMTDGIMTQSHKMPGPNEEVFKHEVFVYRREGKTYLQNSWSLAAPFNIYDITAVYRELIDNNVIRPCGMIALPYSQDTYPGMKLTIKSYLKALAQVGKTAVTDVFKSYKKDVAKIDGKIDKEYRL